MTVLRFDPSRGALRPPGVCACCLGPREHVESRALALRDGPVHVPIPWCGPCRRRARASSFVAAAALLVSAGGGFVAYLRLSARLHRWIGPLLGSFADEGLVALTLVPSLLLGYLLWSAAVRLYTPSGHRLGCDALSLRADQGARALLDVPSEPFAEALLRENPHMERVDPGPR